MNKLLIFDLDDTIFETKSIKKESVKPIFDQLEPLLINKFGTALTAQIIPELWKYPFDFVAEKYKFDKHQNTEFARFINEHEYKLNIRTFDDFSVVENLKQEKILVTTGFSKLQHAKIHYLGIKQKFSEVYIDNILSSERVFKKGIFQSILLERKIEPQLVYIIGDNPNSELKAGFELGLHTVQVAKFGQEKSDYANYCISNFNELIPILK
ncbi:HAD hydrolase-like protein [Kordia sp. YSTF-M3]|uniref:HAD hydrolase-like protein n=1 Tax=Kordia aestuariivivens TaxID=2759037 RepID=A0ABR7Q4P6_9FLAO|nr:HAD family hydrolase [Kordia aestuariivivens]MBC8753522.1 HAD hydrolase-like protein [Kordia aestuariivivens]